MIISRYILYTIYIYILHLFNFLFATLSHRIQLNLVFKVFLLFFLVLHDPKSSERECVVEAVAVACRQRALA